MGAGGLLSNCFVVNLYQCFFFISPYFLFFSWIQGLGLGGSCRAVLFSIYISVSFLFFIFQLETGVGAGGLLLNRQFPPPLTIEHGPDITKEKKNHAKSVEHVF